MTTNRPESKNEKYLSALYAETIRDKMIHNCMLPSSTEIRLLGKGEHVPR